MAIGSAQGSIAAPTAPVPRNRSREKAKTARTNGQAEVWWSVSVAEMRLLLIDDRTLEKEM